MEKNDTLVTPLVVEADGWTLASGSSNRPSESELKAALTGLPVEKPADPPPADPAPVADPVPPVVDDPEPEAPPVVAAPAGARPAGEPPAEPAPLKGKKPNKVDLQKTRIDQLTGQKGDAERALSEERQKRETLEAEIAAIRARDASRPAVPGTGGPAAAAAPAAVDTKPEPVWSGPDGYEAKGKTWEDYQSDHTKWVRETATADAQASAKKLVEEELAKFRTTDEEARKKTAEESARTAVMAAHETRVEAARAKHQDFDTIVEKNLSDINAPYIKHLILHHSDGGELMYTLAHHRAEAEILNDLQPTRVLVDALRYAEHPDKVLLHFAAHPEAFDRINKASDPRQVLVAVGRLDQQLGAPAGTPTPAPISAARPPTRPVVGSPHPTPAPAAKKSELDDVEFGPAYIAEANKKEAQQRHRLRGY